jgi:hypothetical protein
LFAEILSLEGNDTLVITSPFLIETKGSESLMATEWMPYTDQTIFKLPVSMCYFVGELSVNFTQFYGSVVLQSALSKIKREVYDSMADKNDFVTMSEGLSRMKVIANEIQSKFNLSPEFIDFSEFESVLEKNKKDLVLH